MKKQEWKPQPQIKSKTVGPFSWNEALKPEFDAAASFSPNQASAKSFRSAGFGTVLTFQNDGIVRGSSSVVSLGKVVRKKNYLNQGLCHITRFLKAALDKVTLTHLWEQLLC